MKARGYSTPEAFKQALEQRLRTLAGSGVAFPRKRQFLVFDRLLARIALVFGDRATLKGGLVLELRLERTRTTKDIDLRLSGAADDVLPKLQAAGRLELGDFMSFEVRPDDDHPEIRNEGMQYEGLRFRAECKLAGKPYGHPFGVDVAFGDPMLGEPEEHVSENLLAFAGIAPPTLRLYPIETHVAEKLHAYTMPRARPNSRVKDLPDLALLGSTGTLSSKRLLEAFEQTFSFRKTHAVPQRLPDPPSTWQASYAAMAREDELPWPNLDAVADAARAFLDPILATELDATWDSRRWRWRSR